MPLLRASLIVLCALFLSACQRTPLPDNKLIYAGYWTADNMVLLITPAGQVEFKHLIGDVNKTIGGPLKEFDGDDIVVGFAFFTSTLHVSDVPHLDGDHWTMTVDGVTLTREIPEGAVKATRTLKPAEPAQE
ncbi:hypothetical protein A11A3_11483 [Alcanivorax hongdengensis A-11-3]|uniref:Lipoprotein n=1 Tax=Alcanivorax hongdengensis A-11-3 TaxID=1177179 RepID=L0WAN8_9GAMM|nr:hypothetical protein [Alcanivorax hongdengensis]EKF73828.1 hypothetical protein A11A3_11483 [Alcanivorax hongdengensis A-11-3]